jgi:hypothetical protein
MKTVLAILLFILPAFSFAQTPDVADLVAGAIRTGNAKEISKYFADNVDLKVLEQENIYSKAQAELILKDFFTKHPVKEFVVVHKSQPKNDSQFAIGTLTTTNGTYRVHYLMKAAAGVTTVTQFRIENSDE